MNMVMYQVNGTICLINNNHLEGEIFINTFIIFWIVGESRCR